VEEKMVLVEKLISERRIKRYYKSKYETNIRDELDPEDDQQQIYNFYYQTFNKFIPERQEEEFYTHNMQ
jgi:hypothetical protein